MATGQSHSGKKMKSAPRKAQYKTTGGSDPEPEEEEPTIERRKGANPSWAGNGKYAGCENSSFVSAYAAIAGREGEIGHQRKTKPTRKDGESLGSAEGPDAAQRLLQVPANKLHVKSKQFNCHCQTSGDPQVEDDQHYPGSSNNHRPTTDPRTDEQPTSPDRTRDHPQVEDTRYPLGSSNNRHLAIAPRIDESIIPQDRTSGDYQVEAAQHLPGSSQDAHPAIQPLPTRSALRPFDALSWQVRDRAITTGTHPFNMPLDELKKLAQNNVTRQAARRQPQTSNDLRQLFRLALTTPKSAPEEVVLADARVKLQGARNGVYALELKERMTKLRAAVAHAESHPATVIAQRDLQVRQAELELATAEASLELDIKSVARAKLAVTAVTGYTIQDPHDTELDANTARRDAMLDDITDMIKKYHAMEPVVHVAKDKVQVHSEAGEQGEKRKRSAS